MNYPQNIEQKIGFDKIRTLLIEACKCELGKVLIEQIHFSNNYKEIEISLLQIDEMKSIFQFEKDFPTLSFIHIQSSINRIRPEGTYLLVNELFDLRKSLLEISEVLQFFEKRQELYPTLSNLTEGIEIPKLIASAIEKIIDSTGRLKDNASKQLVEIRHSIALKKNAVAKVMNQKIAIARKEGWIEADSELTLRNGRLVLPILSSFKRKFTGIVHDESATGKTSYLEPSEAFEINNDIANLEYEEQKEIIRILKEITDFIRPYRPNIEHAYAFLGNIDAIGSKAKIAIRLFANKPKLSERPEISLIGAKHPLLLISFEKSGKEVIPLRVELDESQRILVISGPNAGGKSICLKTIVLLQYMFQSGLLVPLDENSRMGIFNEIFIDIGDEQSLENDLSTYSSHLYNMKYFLEFAGNKTLVCIDEFGTGTEPMLGGAIAESVLEALHDKKSFGVITTHYTNLKHATTALSHAINGAMLFDVEAMKPMFKLRMGSPGSSFAFEIASTIGLPQNVIQKAKEKLGKEHVDFDKNLKKLEEEKQYIFKKKEDIKKREEHLELLKKDYSQKLHSISQKRLEIIDTTRREIEQVLDTTNKQIEQTIRVIKESQAQKEITKNARESLQEFAKTVTNKIEKEAQNIRQKGTNHHHKIEKSKQLDTNKVLEVGDYACIKGQTVAGQITEIKNKQAIVQFANATMTVTLQNLEIAKKPKTDTSSVIIKSSTKAIAEKRLNFTPKLDVRGMRGDEAMYAVKDFVESGNMLQVKHLEILHGKGYGILRKIIRDYLNTVDFIASATDAPIEMGGDGITIIKII